MRERPSREVLRDLIEESLRAALPPAKIIALQVDEDLVLSGPGSAIDSLSFVNFVVEFERRYGERCGVTVSLLELPGRGTLSQVRTLMDALLS